MVEYSILKMWMKFVLKLKVKVLHYDVVESCQKNLTCYHLGRWMMLVEKDHDGLLIIVIVQTLMSRSLYQPVSLPSLAKE